MRHDSSSLRVIDCHVHPKWSVSYPLREVEDDLTFAEKLVAFMDEQRIDKAVIMPISPFISNEYVTRVVDHHPDRLVGFASVQPNLGRYAVEELEHAIKDLGLRGLKLHPFMQGFSLKNPSVWNCIQKAGELEMPVVLHSLIGDYSTLAFKSKPAPWLATPHDFALLPYICPNTTLIYAHMGGLFNFEEMVQCATFPNVYLETSYSIAQIAKRYPLVEYIKLIGSEKFIFGSDYVPDLTPQEYWPKPQIKIINGLQLSEQDKSNILYKNAQKLLKI
jgi:predicted TIM-barrel fold metal-dependent hydrolase